MKLEILSDIDCEKTWIGPEINHGDFPFRFMLRLQYTSYFSEEWAEKGEYQYEIHAVSVTAAKDKLGACAESMSMSLAEFKELPDVSQHALLVECGVSAPLWQKQCTNKNKGFEEAREELAKIDMLFGFYMDKRINAMGDTGWDWIRGGRNWQRYAVRSR